VLGRPRNRAAIYAIELSGRAHSVAGGNTAYQRVAVTEELLREANLALSLAQTRYQLGLSSIVELSQAQFQQTDAAIGNTDAQYQYRLALATLNYQTGANP